MKASLTLLRVLYCLLEQLDVPVTKKRLRALIKEQPQAGSLKTMVEVLNDLNIESKICKLEEQDLHLIEAPVIVHTRDDVFMVITDFHEDYIEYYNPLSNQKEQADRHAFLEQWTGVVFIPFTDEYSGVPDAVRKEERQKTITQQGIIAGSFLSVCILLIEMFLSHHSLSFIWGALLMIKLCALFVVSQILTLEGGESNTLISRICDTADCGKVLQSKAAKIFPWLTMGDVGALYFGSGAVLLTIAPFLNAPDAVISLLCFINIFTLPYTIFSICYQRFILKTWCPFCLSVMGILWLEFFIGLTVPWMEVFPLSGFLVRLFLFMGITSTTIWFALKKIQTNAAYSKGLQKFVTIVKKDPDVFRALLSQREAISGWQDPLDFVLGDVHAENTLILVITPNCPSCGALYRKVLQYIRVRPEKLKVILRFQTRDREGGWDNQVVDILYALHHNGFTDVALKNLERWYGMENKSIGRWKKDTGTGNLVIPEEAKIMRTVSRQWVSSIGLPGAPALVFNNKLVPLYYTFNDLTNLFKKIF